MSGFLVQVPDVFIAVQIADDEWGIGPAAGDGYPCIAKCSNEECARDSAHFLNVAADILAKSIPAEFIL